MIKLILAASAALLIASPVLAGTADQDAPTKTISARGVDFANREQVRGLYDRIRSAAAQVCDSGSRPVFGQIDDACARDVVAKVVRNLDEPVLTAVYDAQSGSGHAFVGNDQ